MLGKLKMTKQYGKMTSAVADMIVKYGIGLDGTQMFQMFQRDFGGNKL
jgi:hypothetical protein